MFVLRLRIKFEGVWKHAKEEEKEAVFSFYSNSSWRECIHGTRERWLLSRQWVADDDDWENSTPIGTSTNRSSMEESTVDEQKEQENGQRNDSSKFEKGI